MAVADPSLDGTRVRLRQITAEVYASSVHEIRNIGTGSFGSALLVEVTETRERFVAKKISLEHLADGDRDKALNEAALLRSLRHPNISMVKVQSGQCPSSAPAPPRGKPDGSGWLGTPRKRQAHWAPRHCLGCSS